MRFTIYFTLLLSLTVVSAAVVTAEDPLSESVSDEAVDTVDTVVIDGLPVPCVGCQKIDEQRCEAMIGGELNVVRCEELLDYILPGMVVSGSYDGSVPTPKELLVYLYGGQPYVRSRYALQLLEQTAEGLALLNGSVLPLAEMYPKLLLEMVNDGFGDGKLLQSLWGVTSLEQQDLIRLRAFVLNRDPKRSVKDILQDLTVSDLETDFRTLEQYENLFRLLGSTLAADFSYLKSAVSACRSGEPEKSACAASEFRKVAAPLQKYLMRVYVQRLLTWIVEEDSETGHRLRLLAGVPYREYRTPDVHSAVLSALGEVSASQRWDDKFVLLDPNVLEMCVFFAENDTSIDSEVRRLYGDRLAEVESRFSPSVYQPLQKLLTEPEQNTLIDTMRWAVVIVLLSATIAVLCIWKRAFSRSRSDIAVDKRSTTLSAEQRAELRTLRKYFDLNPYANEDDLQRVYRERAKLLHPDMNLGDQEKFSDLSNKYERTKNLINKRWHDA